MDYELKHPLTMQQTVELESRLNEYAGRILSQIKEIEGLKGRIQQLKAENAREQE